MESVSPAPPQLANANQRRQTGEGEVFDDEEDERAFAKEHPDETDRPNDQHADVVEEGKALQGISGTEVAVADEQRSLPIHAQIKAERIPVPFDAAQAEQ